MLSTGVLHRGAERRIQRATRDDLPAIARLVRRAQAQDGIPRISEVEIGELMTHGEMIMLAGERGELVAAACLTTSGSRGHLAFLVVDPRITDVELRLRGVAAALSESKNCEPTFACG